MGFPTSHQSRFYAAPNFLKIRIKYLNLTSVHNFDNTGRKVMYEIYWQGDDPFPLKSWLQVTYPLLKAASFDRFALYRLNRKRQKKKFNYA